MGHRSERGQEKILSHCKFLSFCDHKYFSKEDEGKGKTRVKVWKDEGKGFLAMEVLRQDVSVNQRRKVDLLGDSTVSTSMDVHVDSVEAELNAYTSVKQVRLETDPLMWWKQHVQEWKQHVQEFLRDTT